MKLRTLVLLLISAFVLTPPPAFCKGKKPPLSEEPQEDQIQEDMMIKETPAERQPETPVEPMMETPTKPRNRFEPAAGQEKEQMQEEPMQAETPVKETPQKALPPQAVAGEEEMKIPAGASVHTVWIWQETKDCLWRLAKLYYHDPWKWKKIYVQNRNTILNPNLIYPKQKLVIPPAEQ